MGILDEEDSNGWSLLHEAARIGNIDMISFLTEIGADVTAKTRDGRSVLDIAHHFAEEVGSTTHVDFIRLLELQVDNEELDEYLNDDGMKITMRLKMKITLTMKITLKMIMILTMKITLKM